MNPLFVLANNVSLDYGKVIASGLSYELRIPFFLGAIHYGQEELVKYMTDMVWDKDIIPHLQAICNTHENYEPELISWIKTKFSF